MNAMSFVVDLEIYLEIKELKSVGLTEEEIFGYIDLYIDSWMMKRDGF
jgi:hypothetical protein